MADQPLDIQRSVFAKTASGQQEVQSRALKLGPIPRRLLILIDGKRSTSELATFVAGSDIDKLMRELLAKGCIEAIAAVAAAVVDRPLTNPAVVPIPSAPQGMAQGDFLSQLPDIRTRTTKEVEMARNFMMNTVNTIFQANTRLTLLEAIFSCKTPQAVRDVYPKWYETINSSSIGAKRMPEFHEMLRKVL